MYLIQMALSIINEKTKKLRINFNFPVISESLNSCKILTWALTEHPVSALSEQ